MKLVNLNKKFVIKNIELHVLKDINVSFEKGLFYAIMGRSGSGKSTLINILGLLDNYSSGEYYLENKEISFLSENEKSLYRSLKFGFVFQSFYLNPRLNAIENVMLPTFVNPKINRKDRTLISKQLLEKFNLKDRINHYPSQLSGGEQQRVAIARALINDPEIIIADEPTGNLDEKSEKEVFSILKEISKEGKTVIVVSHNPSVKEYCDVLYELNDGKLVRGGKWKF